MTLKEELLDIKRKQNIAKDKVKENSNLDLFVVYYGNNDELNNKVWSILKSFPSKITYL